MPALSRSRFAIASRRHSRFRPGQEGMLKLRQRRILLLGTMRPMANYVLVVDLGDAAGPTQYLALNRLVSVFGCIPRGPKALRPAQLSDGVASTG